METHGERGMGEARQFPCNPQKRLERIFCGAQRTMGLSNRRRRLSRRLIFRKFS